MELKGLSVLVTGGAGFIGSHLVDKLIAEGCRVNVIDNLANGKEINLSRHSKNPAFRLYKGDINDHAALDAAAKGVDIVFHLACLGVRHSIKHPLENHKVNAEGTLNVLERSRRSGIKRFVYCSSSEVYGTAETVPMKETHRTYPCTVYGASKLAGESYTRAYFTTYAMETVVIRPFNTFGPRSHHEGDAGELIPKSIVRALNGKPILVFGDGRQTRDFTYVEDTASGIAALATRDDAVGQTFNMGSDFEISIKEVCEMIAGLIASAAGIEYVKDRPGDVLRLYADSAKFRLLTGWRPSVPFRAGLIKTIEWFKSYPSGVSALLAQESGVNWE
jgi:UDP-glucose 4-epimerase